MSLHRLAVWFLAFNLLFSPLVFTAAIGAAEAATANGETYPAYPHNLPQFARMRKPGLHSASKPCACVLPYAQLASLPPPQRRLP
jgi:hypothetical protein